MPGCNHRVPGRLEPASRAPWRALAAIARQQGLFALLPIDPAAVSALRRDDAIYMPDSGRINIAGPSDAKIGRFVAALVLHLPS